VTGTVSGTEGIVLPGVKVVIKGSKAGTVTNFDGVYKMNIEETSILVFSHLGYKLKEKRNL